MSVAERAEQIARNTIVKLLSNQEIARVSTAETLKLGDGQEYLDLEHLDNPNDINRRAFRWRWKFLRN